MPQEASSTLDKAVRVLTALQGRASGVSLAEIARTVDMPKPTAHRMLQSLKAHDLVESDGDGRYALGVGLVRLGLGALSGSPVSFVARAELERAASELGATFFLVGARAGRLWILERAEGNAMLRAVPTLGAEVPVASTASGRLYAAFAPDAIDETGARAPRGFREQVERARSQGYDVNDGEWLEGMHVVAAPVRTGDVMHACVACAGPRESFAGAAGRRAIRQTCEVAQRIAQRLGEGHPLARKAAT